MIMLISVEMLDKAYNLEAILSTNHKTLEISLHEIQIAGNFSGQKPNSAFWYLDFPLRMKFIL